MNKAPHYDRPGPHRDRPDGLAALPSSNRELDTDLAHKLKPRLYAREAAWLFPTELVRRVKTAQYFLGTQ